MSYDDGAEGMRVDTIFDLASLTKIFVTTTLSMIFYERDLLDLESPVSAYIPEFRGENKDRVLVKDLLAHTGGLLWWTDLYMKFEGQPPEKARRVYIEAICEMPLDYSPRSKTSYSDLGISALGRNSGARIRKAARRDGARGSLRSSRDGRHHVSSA